ncbi:hypothetical protein ACO2I3_01925 [Leptospira interrogans]
MELLVAFVVIAFVGWCLYRLFMAGAFYGARQAIGELVRGIGSHCDTEDGDVPRELGRAIDKTKTKKTFRAYVLSLWKLGDEMGRACWTNGVDFEQRSSQPKPGTVQLSITERELRDLHWIAHIGFEAAMMSNARESRRFQSEQEAQSTQEAIDHLERKLPRDAEDNDPFALSFNRQTLIWSRWPSEPPRS